MHVCSRLGSVVRRIQHFILSVCTDQLVRYRGRLAGRSVTVDSTPPPLFCRLSAALGLFRQLGVSCTVRSQQTDCVSARVSVLLSCYTCPDQTVCDPRLMTSLGSTSVTSL